MVKIRQRKGLQDQYKNEELKLIDTNFKSLSIHSNPGDDLNPKRQSVTNRAIISQHNGENLPTIVVSPLRGAFFESNAAHNALATFD